MTLKLFALLILSMVSVSVGELYLKIGMDQIGEVSVRSMSDALRLPLMIVKSRFLLIGIPLMCVYFYSYLVLLSRADLSYVLPLTSISFVLGTFLAWLVLHEEISTTRWLGTVVICLGVAMVASGEAKTEKQRQWQSSASISVSR